MRTWVWRIKKASLRFVSISPEKPSIQDWTLLERSPVLQGETDWEIQGCSNRVEQEAMKSLISENLEEFLMRKVRDIDNVLAPPSPLFAPPHLILLLFTLPFSSPPSFLPSFLSFLPNTTHFFQPPHHSSSIPPHCLPPQFPHLLYLLGTTCLSITFLRSPLFTPIYLSSPL